MASSPSSAVMEGIPRLIFSSILGTSLSLSQLLHIGPVPICLTDQSAKQACAGAPRSLISVLRTAHGGPQRLRFAAYQGLIFDQKYREALHQLCPGVPCL